MNILTLWHNPVWPAMLVLFAALVAAIVVLWQQVKDLQRSLQESANLAAELNNEKRKVYAHKKFLRRLAKENQLLFLTHPELSVRKFTSRSLQEACKCGYCKGETFLRSYYDRIVLEDKYEDLI